MPALSPVSLQATLPALQASDSPEKVREAAGQFEALLMGQILRSVRESGGWLGTSDSTADCAMEFAEQQFAGLLAQQGGLGLASLIEQGLRAGKTATEATPGGARVSDTQEAAAESAHPGRS